VLSWSCVPWTALHCPWSCVPWTALRCVTRLFLGQCSLGLVCTLSCMPWRCTVRGHVCLGQRCTVTVTRVHLGQRCLDCVFLLVSVAQPMPTCGQHFALGRKCAHALVRAVSGASVLSVLARGFAPKIAHATAMSLLMPQSLTPCTHARTWYSPPTLPRTKDRLHYHHPDVHSLLHPTGPMEAPCRGTPRAARRTGNHRRSRIAIHLQSLTVSQSIRQSVSQSSVSMS
jgi:hypothetical protein